MPSSVRPGLGYGKMGSLDAYSSPKRAWTESGAERVATVAGATEQLSQSRTPPDNVCALRI
jgi:hypothetical protein